MRNLNYYSFFSVENSSHPITEFAIPKKLLFRFVLLTKVTGNCIVLYVLYVLCMYCMY